MKLSVEAATHKFRSLLTGCGISGNLSWSNISKSMYLEISPDDDPDVETLKIRVSDHELPHHHYLSNPSDIELGPNNIYAFGSLDRYPELAAHICDRYGLPYSANLRRILTRRKNAAQAAAQERADREAIRAMEAASRIDAARPIYAAHHAEIDAQAAHIETLSGQPRCRARSKFNQRWGEYAYELRELAKDNK